MKTVDITCKICDNRITIKENNATLTCQKCGSIDVCASKKISISPTQLGWIGNPQEIEADENFVSRHDRGDTWYVGIFEPPSITSPKIKDRIGKESPKIIDSNIVDTPKIEDKIEKEQPTILDSVVNTLEIKDKVESIVSPPEKKLRKRKEQPKILDSFIADISKTKEKLEKTEPIINPPEKKLRKRLSEL